MAVRNPHPPSLAGDPNLTLSLGLRYEYYPLMTRADRGLERYDPATNMVLFGRRGDNPDNVGIKVSKTMFAPRVGFAYRMGANTVIRSGYGITYDPLPFSRPLRGPYPATISQTFVGANTFTPFGDLAAGIPAFTGPDLTPGSARCPLRSILVARGQARSTEAISNPGISSSNAACPATWSPLPAMSEPKRQISLPIAISMQLRSAVETQGSRCMRSSGAQPRQTCGTAG